MPPKTKTGSDKSKEASYQILRGTIAHRAGSLSVAEAVKEVKTSPTAPSTLAVVATIATHGGDRPLLRQEIMDATGLEQGTLSRTAKLLTTIGAMEEGVVVRRIGDKTRPMLTLVPSERFGEFVGQYPEWRDAIESKQIEDQAAQLAEQQGLTRNEVMQAALAAYAASLEPPANS